MYGRASDTMLLREIGPGRVFRFFHESCDGVELNTEFIGTLCKLSTDQSGRTSDNIDVVTINGLHKQGFFPSRRVELVDVMTVAQPTIRQAAAPKDEPLTAPSERLVAFLWVLLRDEVSFGAVESIMKNHVEKIVGKNVFDDPHLEAYVRDLAKRLVTP